MREKTTLDKMFDFLGKQYQDALDRYNHANFDMDSYDAASFWATRKADVKDSIGSMLFFAYLEMYGDDGEKMARIELERIRKSAWKSFMGNMIEKYHLPDDWKALHEGSIEDVDLFLKMLADYKELHKR